MAEEIDNLVLEHLKAIRNELRDFRSRFDDEMDDLKTRMSSLEAAMVTVKGSLEKTEKIVR